MAELNKLLKFSEAILIKKIGASIKYIKEENPEYTYVCDYALFDKEELAELCLTLDAEVKAIKDELTNKKNLALEQQRLEEEEEKANRLAEKLQKEQFITDNAIVDCSLMDRLKFRFFNLATFDSEDPEGLNPLYSPPFYETKEEQFSEELRNSSFKVYTATYNGESMSGKPEFMQKNLNKSFVSIVEESQYIKMLFVSFRIIVKDDICRYKSVWISNIKQDLSSILDFDMFDLKEIDLKEINLKEIDIKEIDIKEQDKHNVEFKMLQDDSLIDQIFAR
jgi:hypothetical protein